MKKPKFITEFDDIPSSRQKMEDLPLEERAGSFIEVEKGFTEEEALAEARRCLSCRRCIGCGLCLAECDRKAIVYDDDAKNFDLEVDAVILTPGCGIFDATRKRNLGYGEAANVITSIELERILSPTGPYGGRALRPYDGRVPKRVAMIQCVGCREEGIGANYCASICCVTAIKQANALRKRVPDSEIVIYHRGIRPWGGRSEAYYLDAEKDPKIHFVEADVSAVKEADGTGNLSLTSSSNGSEHTEEFNLVVLSVALASSRSGKGLARKVRAKTNKYGFCTTGPFTPLHTTAEGVFVAGAFSGPKGISESVCEATGAAAAVLASLGGGQPPGDETRAAPSPVGAKTGILLCRYGLKTHGLPDLEDLKSRLSKTGGIDWVAAEEFACRALRRTSFKEEIRGRKIGTLVTTCYGSSHQALFDHAFKEGETGVSSRLVDFQLADEVTADWIAGQVVEIMTPGEPAGAEKIDAFPRVAIVGGGPTGMSTALNLAQQGIEVDLIGVGSPLGGHVARLMMPVEGEESPEDLLKSHIEAIEASDRIHIHTDTRVTSISGEPGAFQLTGSRSGSQVSFSAGAVVVATGAADYEPTEYQGDGRILTQAELEERLAEGHLDYCRLVMIQCVGSRTDDYPVCSQICCSQAVRNALRLKAADSKTEITILHRDIRVFGLDEDLYTEAMEEGVTFIKTAPGPRVITDGALTVEFTDDAGAQKNLETDGVVLSTGLRPSEGSSNIAGELGLVLEDTGFFKPLDRNLHPVESNRKGIFVCGLATGPKPLSECFAEGLAAAGRAAAFLRDQT